MNSQTGEPVRGALVRLNIVPLVRGDAAGFPDKVPRLAPVLTDASGSFQLSGLPAGRYLVDAEKPGFQANRPAINGDIVVGPSRDGITLRLTPLAKIHGRVADRDGEPVARVAIRALRSQIQDGRRVTIASRSVTTDDLGRYRLWNLEPGAYYVLAAGRGGGTQLYVGYTAAAPSSHESFPPVYYGGGSDRASAMPIALTAGQEFEANLEVAMQPAVRIRGRLRNTTPYQQVQVELWRGGQDLSVNRAAVNAATGQFELEDVVPGTYLLRASQGTGNTMTRGQREIQVGDADIEGVVLNLAPGVDITGRVQMTGSGTGRGPICSLRLYPAVGDGNGPGGNGVADREGKITAHGVLQGRYRVVVAAFSGYVLSATSGSVDLLRGGDLIVGAGLPPEPIEIVLRTDGGNVAGTTPVSEKAPAVLLVPSGGGTPMITMAFQGKFGFDNIAPGDYQAYLLKDADAVEYRNPEALRALGRGEPMRVTSGATANVELKGVQQ